MNTIVSRAKGRLALAGVFFWLSACQTVPRFPAVNLDDPTWTVRRGQAVWQRGQNDPEIAGEIVLATQPEGRCYVQFSKNGLPLVIAQTDANHWEAEVPTQNKRYSGSGLPPKQLLVLYLPRALAGQTLPQGWTWNTTTDGGWRLENQHKGESLEGYFSQ
jgi:hypothetical protein